MKGKIGFLCAAVVLAAGAVRAGSLRIDHRHTDVTRLTQAQIERAKSALHIAYGHTSHGSQLTDGMSALVGFANGGGKGLALPANIFAWNNGGHDGALDLHDGALCNDVGYYPDWVVCTSNYLDDPENADVNVILWSWCGQMTWKYSDGSLSNEYLLPMAQLERDYPDVTFVYMTGHVDTNFVINSNACEAIRAWCSVSNRVLYDFNDIEHHDPDGVFYPFVDDYCGVYSGIGGPLIGNWAEAWQNAHVQGADWYDCSAAHSLPLNGNLKAYAAWALWCALGADRDRDGLADAWEERHGGADRFGGGTNDFDADGLTDWEEYVQDSAPTNSGARFAIAGLAPGAAALEFPSSPDRVYALRARTNLLAGGWNSVTSRPGTGATMSLADEAPAAGVNVYRVEVSVPE